MDNDMLTILVVEDEPLIRMLLTEALEDEGYGVREARTVLEAVAILGLHDIDAVITDIDMPGGLNGLDLAKLLQGYGKRIPTIVTSGGHQLDDDMLPGEARFVPKPYSVVAMLSLLGQLFLAQPDRQREGAQKTAS